jgi:ribonuclease HII
MSAKPKIKDIEEHIRELEIESALDYLLKTQEEYQISLSKLIIKYEKKKAAVEKEKARFQEMSKFEIEAFSKGYSFIAGADEAGRGPLAGSVVAAAVILPENVFIENLNDSKQLSAVQRDRLFIEVKEKAISYGIGIVDEKCIDEVNILNATKIAMKQAIEALKPQPDILLIDAVKLDGIQIPQVNIIKGDTLSISIAAASILAKVTRDRMIDEMDSLYPQYGFLKHKGYGTKDHIEAIKKFGICPIHRLSFTKNFTL